MGSRLKKEEVAYIAGFLDGDGSLMMQVKKRKDGKLGWRFMFTICFYQDSRHAQPLGWMRRKFGIGYLSNRNDGITELRINGYEQVGEILGILQPFIRFKRVQATAILHAIKILNRRKFALCTKQERTTLRDIILKIQNENYQSRHKKTKEYLSEVLSLTPYRLSPKG